MTEGPGRYMGSNSKKSDKSSLFLNNATAEVNTIVPRTARPRNWGQSTDIPTPFKKTPLIMTIKYLKGLRSVNHWMILGIFAIGKISPLNNRNGRIKKNVVIMACCCVPDTVDMKSPIPMVLIKYKQTPAKSTRKFPLKGTLNHRTAKIVTIII